MNPENNEQIVDKEKKEEQRGASLVEYTLLVALIAIVSIVAVRTLGNTISNQLRKTASQLSG